MKLPSLICITSVFYTAYLLKNVVYGESCQNYNSKLLRFILSMHFFKFQEKTKEIYAIHQPGSVCIGENCALSLEYCPWLCYLRPGAQFFPMQTSHLANNIYLLYKLLCCARMSNPKNSHNSTLVKLPYFFTCLISPISCWHINRFLHQSVRLMNEPGYAFTISQHCKFKFLTESDIQNFIEAEENQRNKKTKVTWL